ncbi:hypothetical protein MiSe_93230 [Microseira wollei NIES-4236]|uniref:Uncharacterized protein n=2 Tax=Microseira wollei TaxID=467598 RepID=A0AAV3XQ38_9CYAN|nr:hypothetical protein MiSe_93230 [Microseira wollei NIES-4236]
MPNPQDLWQRSIRLVQKRISLAGRMPNPQDLWQRSNQPLQDAEERRGREEERVFVVSGHLWQDYKYR